MNHAESTTNRVIVCEAVALHYFMADRILLHIAICFMPNDETHTTKAECTRYYTRNILAKDLLFILQIGDLCLGLANAVCMAFRVASSSMEYVSRAYLENFLYKEPLMKPLAVDHSRA